ncbi:contractile injection system protein, VgrG/Pvc8 family [Halomonas sp. PA16-9]|uniref:contractile injection system protein, VgrG/Pvc8 family n=1 Tax=Halomonas sp. PA16-9 TaxID=2576841 RepID=UPI0030EDFAA2
MAGRRAATRVHGIIAELHRGDRGHRRSFYRVEIRPALWRLSLRHNSRIFQDASPFDAITRSPANAASPISALPPPARPLIGSFWFSTARPIWPLSSA